jgi:hypothetical protein
MENKIRINAEVEVLRLSIPSNKGTLVVNNPKIELKNEMIKYLVNCMIEDKDIDEKRIVLELIDNCTNVEFDMDIFEAKNLSHEAQMITNEILIIFQEIVGEAGQVVRLVLQQTKNEIEQKEIVEENKEMKKEKVEEKEIEEIPHKVVKKPQRSRGKMVRK